MLSSLLSKKECAACKFCCSFRRQSLWETPLFDEKTKETLEKKYPNAKFKPSGNSSFTIFLEHCYKTDNSEEEAPCPFLDTTKGCVLNKDEKPFDCSIWPLRVCKNDSGLFIVLENTCPTLSKKQAEVCALLKTGLAKKIILRAQSQPDMIKEFKKDFAVVYKGHFEKLKFFEVP